MIILTAIWSRHLYVHVTKEENFGTERLGNLPKVSKLETDPGFEERPLLSALKKKGKAF